MRWALILLLIGTVFAANPVITRVQVVPNESVKQMGVEFQPVTLAVNFTDADDPVVSALNVSWRLRRGGAVYGPYNTTPTKVTTNDFISNYTLTPGKNWPLGWYEVDVRVSNTSDNATSGFNQSLKLNGTSSTVLRPLFEGRGATRYVLLRNGTSMDKVRLKVTVW